MAGGTGGELEIGRVQFRQRLAGLDFGAGIDHACRQFAGDAKSQIEFIAGADFAGIDAGSCRGAGGWLNQYDPVGGGGRVARLAAREQ